MPGGIINAGRALAMALLGVVASCPPPAHGAAISFNTALPVARDQWIWRQLGFRREASLQRPRAGLAADGTTTVIGYGLTPRLALFAAAPVFRQRRLRLQAPDPPQQRDASGLGDLRFTARYTLWQHNRPGETLRLAPFASVEAPSGDAGGTDRFGPLPPMLTPGSGSWDVSLGTIGTWQTLDHQFDLQLFWRRNGRDDGFRFGRQIGVDASWQQRIWPPRLTEDSAFVYAVVESRFRDTSPSERLGTDVAGTAAQRWLVGPGLQYVTRRWIAELLVLLPAAQDTGDAAPRDDFRVLAGWRVNF